MTVDALGAFLWKPLFAAIYVVSDQLLLLGVDRHNGSRCCQRLGGPSIDIAELGVPIGIVCTFFGLPITLQAIALLM